MKYNVANVAIPQEKRKELNDKILHLIDSGEFQGIKQEDIFNAYTGDGGLHELNFNDFESFHAYTEAKKEIEAGQFFTPDNICKEIIDIIKPEKHELICDPTCGHGAFFNHINESNCYGADIDFKAIKVAKYLYPKANVIREDIRYYNLDIKMDIVVGNPPFNIKFNIDKEEMVSQLYWFKKASELIKPGGIIAVVVPDSFLKDEFFSKSAINEIENCFDFICQYKLDRKAFSSLGVENFETKVMFWQAKSEHTEPNEYKTEYTTKEHASLVLKGVRQIQSKLRVKLHAEFLSFQSRTFKDKLKKYLFEIKTHPALVDYYAKALAYIHKFDTQECPAGEDYSKWYKNSRITENMVLSYLKRTVKKQNYKPVDVTKIVRNKYGIKYKPYSNKAKRQLSSLDIDMFRTFNQYCLNKPLLLDAFEQHYKSFEKKKQEYLLQTMPFHKMKRSEVIDKYLKNFTFLSKLGLSKFNEIQIHDLGLILQKKYSVLNWQQGSGKTAAGFAWSQYDKQKNTFIVSAALAINITWKTFLTVNNIPFIQIKSIKDIENIKTGDYILISHEYLVKYEKQIKKFVKKQSQKVNLLFDESDDITNNTSKRTKAILNCFRRVKRKLLTTGTTTRNNITELYSQLELLYNNSVNMISWPEFYYIENKDKNADRAIVQKENKYYKKPFPPYYGNTTFKRCFNPSKSSVFGIQKHNQDLYNESYLSDIIQSTIITRKFKEIAGDKYNVKTVSVYQTVEEKAVYLKIIKDLNEILPSVFNSTGNSRKDAMLRIIRQLTLLIEATSTPHLFDFYKGIRIPNKAVKIMSMIEEFNEKVAVGFTHVKAVEWYESELMKKFPNRKIFKITGKVTFKQRDSIIKEFENTENGILLSTQQSLKSSINIPSCNKVIVESLQWNIPKIEQWYFRFIRYDSEHNTDVYFVNYENTIEMNLLALLMAKEKLNDFIKTLEYRENNDIYSEFGIDESILETLITKEKDEDGKVHISWGESKSIN